jgi:hypothetical protein
VIDQPDLEGILEIGSSEEHLHKGVAHEKTSVRVIAIRGIACPANSGKLFGPRWEFTRALRSELEGMVAGPAAMALDSQGRFRLEPPVSSDVPILTEQQARAIAAAWPKDFGSYILPFLEETRGGKINLSTLAPCGTPYYAEGAYEVPVAGVADRFTRPYGGWWIIGLCGGGGTPEVSIAISATSTDVTVNENGIVLPPHSGNNFFAVGIPKHWSGPIGESAEAAV